MQCPRCKTHDVYVSQKGNQPVLSFLFVTARCHRCCHLFQVPRWRNVPKKVATVPTPTQSAKGPEAMERRRRAA